MLWKEQYSLKLNYFVILIFNLFLLPHIVNLTCKAVISVITDIKYINDAAEGYKDYEPDVFFRDCIAIVQSVVNAVSDIIFILLLLKTYRSITAI